MPQGSVYGATSKAYNPRTGKPSYVSGNVNGTSRSTPYGGSGGGNGSGGSSGSGGKVSNSGDPLNMSEADQWAILNEGFSGMDRAGAAQERGLSFAKVQEREQRQNQQQHHQHQNEIGNWWTRTQNGQNAGGKKGGGKKGGGKKGGPSDFSTGSGGGLGSGGLGGLGGVLGMMGEGRGSSGRVGTSYSSSSVGASTTGKAPGITGAKPPPPVSSSIPGSLGSTPGMPRPGSDFTVDDWWSGLLKLDANELVTSSSRNRSWGVEKEEQMFHVHEVESSKQNAANQAQKTAQAMRDAAIGSTTTFTSFADYRKKWGNFLIREGIGQVQQMIPDVIQQKRQWYKATLSKDTGNSSALGDTTFVSVNLMQSIHGQGLVAASTNLVLVRSLKDQKLLFIRPMKPISFDGASSWVQSKASSARVNEFWNSQLAAGAGGLGTTMGGVNQTGHVKVEICNPGNLISLLREVEGVVKAETCLGKFKLLDELDKGPQYAGAENNSLIAQTLLKGKKAVEEVKARELKAVADSKAAAVKTATAANQTSQTPKVAGAVSKAKPPPPPPSFGLSGGLSGAISQATMAQKQASVSTAVAGGSTGTGTTPIPKFPPGCTEPPLYTTAKNILETMRNDTIELAITNNMLEFSCPKGLNESQRSVLKLVTETREGFTLVQGPPGTGKSTTMSWILNCIYLKDWDLWFAPFLEQMLNVPNCAAKYHYPHASGVSMDSKDDPKWTKFYDEKLLDGRPRILVTAPSNQAVDEMMKKVVNFFKPIDTEHRDRYVPRVKRMLAAKRGIKDNDDTALKIRVGGNCFFEDMGMMRG